MREERPQKPGAKQSPPTVGAYSVHTAADVLGITPRRVRRFLEETGAAAPRVDPVGPSHDPDLSFQDLVLLRTMKRLSEQLPGTRVNRALRRLRHQLPVNRSMSELCITAEGREVVARDGDVRWVPASGQILLDLQAGPRDPVGAISPRSDGSGQMVPFIEASHGRALVRAPTECAADAAADCFDRACRLELKDPRAAIRAYEQAISIDPEHVDAHLSLGRLRHESGDLSAAEVHFRAARCLCPDEVAPVFNLGVALEDLGRPREALEAYQTAIAIDPKFADAHFNAARVAELVGHAQAAFQHLQTYRRIVRSRS